MSTTASSACMVRLVHFNMASLRYPLQSVDAGGTETTGTALGLRQFGHLGPGDAAVGGDDHLRDAFAAVDHEGLVAVVDQHDADLAAVIGIHGAGRIQHGDAVF